MDASSGRYVWRTIVSSVARRYAALSRTARPRGTGRERERAIQTQRDKEQWSPARRQATRAQVTVLRRRRVRTAPGTMTETSGGAFDRRIIGAAAGRTSEESVFDAGRPHRRFRIGPAGRTMIISISISITD